jgi:hypothetical protein
LDGALCNRKSFRRTLRDARRPLREKPKPKANPAERREPVSSQIFKPLDYGNSMFWRKVFTAGAAVVPPWSASGHRALAAVDSGASAKTLVRGRDHYIGQQYVTVDADWYWSEFMCLKKRASGPMLTLGPPASGESAHQSGENRADASGFHH